MYTGTGAGFYEGPVWLGGAGVLLYSEMLSTTGVPTSNVLRIAPPSTESVLGQDTGTNGLAVTKDGTVIGASHKVQGLVQIDTSTGKVTTILNTDASGHHFNSPNDLTIHTNGTIYFSDPDYQLGSRTSETKIKGIYRVTPTHAVSLVDGTFSEPNGVALSPDEKTLYAADTARGLVRRFDVATDGTTTNLKDFATVTEPDGMAVDCAGNLYVASNTPGYIRVIAPSGQELGAIKTASKITNLAFGGTDRKTLYFVASKVVYSLPVNLPGFPY